MFVSMTQILEFSITCLFSCMKSMDISSNISMCDMAKFRSPFSSSIAMYVEVGVLLSTSEFFMSMPIVFACSIIFLPCMSSPTAVISFVETPRCTRFSAIFLPTPPRDIFTFPGFESPGIRLLFGKPVISTFEPPITVM